MNFLAHAYLSNNHEEIMVGNFIADKVKGKSHDQFPKGIQNGILLHRFIDDYCDHHEINVNSSKILAPYFGKYSMVVMDIINDHFLALHWKKFHSTDYKIFVDHFYATLTKHQHHFPDHSKQILPFMIQQNWIDSYQNFDGIIEILKRMSRRTKFASNMDQAHAPIRENFEELEYNFHQFFPEMKTASSQKLQSLLENG